MNFKIYVNYFDDNRIHAGIFIGDEGYYSSISETEIGSSPKLKGYIDVQIRDGIQCSWELVENIVRDGLAQIGTITEGRMHDENTTDGTFNILVRPGVPQTQEHIVRELRSIYDRICKEGQVKQTFESVSRQ